MKTKAKEKSLYLLDLNAILDGRVLELASYKFIDGKILISKQFVDDLKSKLSSTNQTEKNTAKRGIRVIDELKKSKNLNIEIKSFPPLINDTCQNCCYRSRLRRPASRC